MARCRSSGYRVQLSPGTLRGGERGREGARREKQKDTGGVQLRRIIGIPQIFLSELLPPLGYRTFIAEER